MWYNRRRDSKLGISEVTIPKLGGQCHTACPKFKITVMAEKMAAALRVGLYDNEDEDGHLNRNVMAERLPRPHNVTLHFPDYILILFYRLPRHFILNLVEELRPALERPTRRHGALAVTNALPDCGCKPVFGFTAMYSRSHRGHQCHLQSCT